MPSHEARALRRVLPLITFMICMPATADTLVHGFRNPAFSGVGYSSHVLTIENQERNRREELKDERVSEALAAERDAENTVEARFLRNLESRIYSQLSRQLVDNLFGESPSTSGTFQLLDSTVSFEDNGQEIRLVIENPDGVTELVLPSEQFLF